jgi:hypothetical protein
MAMETATNAPSGYVVIYHKFYGPSSMPITDAVNVVRNFPDEWAEEPWTDDTKAGKKRKA